MQQPQVAGVVQQPQVAVERTIIITDLKCHIEGCMSFGDDTCRWKNSLCRADGGCKKLYCETHAHIQVTPTYDPDTGNRLGESVETCCVKCRATMEDDQKRNCRE